MPGWRVTNNAQIDAIVTEWTLGLTTAEAIDALNRNEIAASPIRNFADIVAWKHLRSRDMLQPRSVLDQRVPRLFSNLALQAEIKVDLAASAMPETSKPERLTPGRHQNRNGGRDHLGILGEIKSVHAGEIIGIRIEGLRSSKFPAGRSCDILLRRIGRLKQAG
jgi:hypothetical protein